MGRETKTWNMFEHRWERILKNNASNNVKLRTCLLRQFRVCLDVCMLCLPWRHRIINQRTCGARWLKCKSWKYLNFQRNFWKFPRISFRIGTFKNETFTAFFFVLDQKKSFVIDTFYKNYFLNFSIVIIFTLSSYEEFDQDLWDGSIMQHDYELLFFSRH